MEEKKIDEKNSKRSVKNELLEEEEEEVGILKKRISRHPLYGLLLEAHLNCIKVCSGDDSTVMGTEDAITLLHQITLRPDSSHDQTSPELDHFMETYCWSLRELKETMEKPLQETDRFVDFMYAQLNGIVPSSPYRKSSSTSHM